MASFTAGTTFVDGVANDVTAAKLGALITNATPTSGLIQDRTAETVVATNDTFLIGDASDSNTLKRMTVANVMKAELTGTINTTAGTITTGVIPTLTSTTKITSGTGTAAAPAISPTGDTNTGIFFPAADTLAATTNGTERLRIDSAGNVGIGTTSPTIVASSSKVLDIVGTLSGAVRFERTSSTNPTYGYVGATNGAVELNAQSESAIVLSTNGTNRLNINSSGQVGVGVTPSAWGASEYKAIQVGIGGSISGRVSGGDQDKVNVAANVYHDGTNFKYIATDSASIYQQTGGFHIFSNAPSGTAGSTASFTESLSIDSSGNVGVNTTTASAKLDARTTGNGWIGRFLNSTATGTPQGVQIVVGQDSTNVVLDVAQGTDYTTTTSLLKVQGNGNVGIGVASPSAKLDVNGTIDATSFTSGTGTAIAPAICPATDTNTGFFFPAENTIAFAQGGAEAMRINSSGNVSIGTATALSKLHVHGDLTMSNATVSTTAATGGFTLPATAAGYLTVSINGTSRKIPYYA